MLLAELEIYHSRPIAPTRRVALGRARLPVEPPPGFGGVLLGAIVADNVGDIEPDLVPDLLALTHQLQDGRRIPQPRLRHRFQVDRVGLQRSTHRLVGEGEDLQLDFDHVHGNPAQQLLGAVYAAGQLPVTVRPVVFATVRRALGWSGPVGPDLIASLAGFDSGRALSARALENPIGWAMELFGFTNGSRPTGRRTPPRADVQARFRTLLRTAHPDHGGDTGDAAQRIADLSEARRILLGPMARS